MPKHVTGSEVAFVDEEERLLFGRFNLGEDVRHFLTNDSVGQLLQHRAKAAIKQAEIDALEVEVDGWRGWLHARRKLRAIRQRAEVARTIIQWLAEAIHDGNQAESELNEYRT